MERSSHCELLRVWNVRYPFRMCAVSPATDTVTRRISQDARRGESRLPLKSSLPSNKINLARALGNALHTATRDKWCRGVRSPLAIQTSEWQGRHDTLDA